MQYNAMPLQHFSLYTFKLKYFQILLCVLHHWTQSQQLYSFYSSFYDFDIW